MSATTPPLIGLAAHPRAHVRKPRCRPLGGEPPDTPKHLKYEKEATPAQARWLTLPTNERQIFARHSSEYIQFDEPGTVISAIREVYDQAGRPVTAHGH